jgi:glyoxylase-like metal-dependent hydrolase (beta-lactamase superfamily II)
MSEPALLPAGVTVFERGWLSSNNVLFASGARSAIVDTGYVTHASQTVALVRDALGSRPLDLIVNTHLHSDHCGGNAALQAAFPSARTLIPPGEADAVRAWNEDALSYKATGQRCDRFDFDGVIGAGSTLELGPLVWEVHAAPGHDPHSIVLFEPSSRTLISADALWEDGFGVVFPELEGTAAFDEVGATLDLIEALRPRVVVPGHGSVFGGRERVEAAVSNARRRLENFVRDPGRHANHAMKVLIKFKLLEWQSVPEDRFAAWAEGMPYLQRVHARFFAATELRAWLLGLVAELVKSGVLARSNGVLVNI